MTLGKLATVWDREVCRVRGVLEDILNETNILILSDLQAAINVVNNAGYIGKVRTYDLKIVLKDIKERQTRLGPGAVSFRWVKVHNELYSNEEVD